MSRRTERMAQEAAQQANKMAQQPAPEPQVQESETESKQVKIVRPHNEAHDQAHEEIERNYLKRLGVSEEGEPEPVPATEPAAPVTQDVATPEPVQAEPVAAEPEFVKVKVDGEEFDVPKSEVDEYGGVKAYQIQRAAENRLKKANESVAEARKLQDAVAQMAIQQFQKSNPQQPQITNDQFIAEKLYAIRYGPEEEGSKAMAEVVARLVPRIDQAALIRQATQQAMFEMRMQSGVDKFREEFADVTSNPHLLKLSVLLENERLSQMNPQARASLDWQNFYKTIGNEVRSIVGKQNQPTTAPPTQGNTSQQSEKEARKASITVLPTASARAAVNVEKELTPEEARKQALEEMQGAARKLRGESTG